MAGMRVIVTPIFAAVAVLQAVRYFQAWPVTINGWPVPLWASAVAAVVCALLAIMVWRDGARRRR